MKPNCERCDIDLAADGDEAHICSFECTFCRDCAVGLSQRCPNCGGALVQRPSRAAALWTQFPPSTERVFNAKHQEVGA